MTIDPSAITVTLMTPEVDPHQHQQATTTLITSEAVQQDDVKPKTPGSSRRGKQYKCGNCHELGHNQKTCPRRASNGSDTAAIQPAIAIDATELFGSVAGTVAPPISAAVAGNGHPGPPMPISRIFAPKLDAALEAANKRVFAADKQVAAATTDQEFEEATAILDNAVRNMEKIASCAHRCAVINHTLSGGWDNPGSAEPQPKRLRLDHGGGGALTPTPITLNDTPAGGSADPVDGGDVVPNEGKEEPIE